ncbi:hypothetical protein C8Q79DRAFT_544157 [Trametes meyenii]|nr:hypothetical protein C8Q79DRAFT_544157 [Trametes meyenii]
MASPGNSDSRKADNSEDTPHIALKAYGVVAVNILVTIIPIIFHLPPPFVLPQPLGAFPQSDRTGYRPSPTMRGTVDILLPCLTTFATCVYTAIHFDVQEPREGQWRRIWTKASLLAMAIFFPEILVMKACCELMLARRDVTTLHRHGVEGWTLKLAFAANMGALTGDQYHRDVRSGVALYHSLASHVGPRRDLDIFSWSWQDIQDKLDDHTKANTLMKMLTMLQIIRFMLGTFIRWVTKSPIAPLETVTCAYAFCAVLYYGFWFKKPYGIQRACNISDCLRRGTSRPRPSRPNNKKHTPQEYHVWLESEDHGVWDSKRELTSEPYAVLGAFVALISSTFVAFMHFVTSQNIVIQDQASWELNCIYLFVTPALLFIILVIEKGTSTKVFTRCGVAWFLIGRYFFARLALLYSLFHSFDDLPKGVYDTASVRWLSYIPFIH